MSFTMRSPLSKVRKVKAKGGGTKKIPKSTIIKTWNLFIKYLIQRPKVT